jgi:hypothetical protein
MNRFSSDSDRIVVSQEFGVIGDRPNPTEVEDSLGGSEGGSFDQEFAPVNFWGEVLCGHDIYRGFEQC